MSTTEAVKIDAKLVKELREKSGAPMGDCLKALQEAKGDMEDAFVVLRKRGMASAAKKASRSTNEGAVGTYIHAGGKIGVLLELNCESDFVARTDDFQELLKDIAMHIAAADPRYVGKDEVTPEDIEREKEIYRAQAAASGKPANIIEKMLEGKMGKFYEEVCLLEQPFIKEQTQTIAPAHRAQGRQARREHQRPPLRPLQDRRSQLHRRLGQGYGCRRARRLSASTSRKSKEPGNSPGLFCLCDSLQASGSIARDQAEEPGKNHRAKERHEDAVEEAARAGEAEMAEQKSARERSQDADDDVADDAEAAALHHLAGQPTRNQAN